LEASGGLAEIMFQKAAQAFPAGNPARGRTGFIFRSNGFVARRLMLSFDVMKFQKDFHNEKTRRGTNFLKLGW